MAEQRRTPDGSGIVLDAKGSDRERVITADEAVPSTMRGTRDVRLKWPVREGAPLDEVRISAARADTLVKGGHAEYIDEGDDGPAGDEAAKPAKPVKPKPVDQGDG